jgi:gag-polypeptide of LTR copia-type
MSEEYTSGNYWMEMLKATNWMPWKRRMLAVLRDLGLEKYIAADAKIPESANRSKPTADELKAQRKWCEGDTKTCTQIELVISDAKMIHISGAMTVREIWSQLSLVKESKGWLGVLATQQALYRATAEEGFDMINHISYLWKLQEELHLMDNKVTNEDFVMILITSLLESWDNYTSSYLRSSGNKPTLSSHKLIAILMEEDWRRKGCNSDLAGTSLQAKQNKGKGTGKSTGDPNVECYNCHKKGHMSKDCWAKGGGKEGQGSKGRKGPNRNKSNQAQEANSSLNKVSYMAYGTREINQFNWIFNTGSTSHICTQRDAFIDYYPLQNSTITGIGPMPATAMGKVPWWYTCP